jgi:hypothetical protein
VYLMYMCVYVGTLTFHLGGFSKKKDLESIVRRRAEQNI